MAKRSNEALEEIPQVADTIASKYRAKEVRTLLAEAHQLREAEKRLKEVKARLAEIIREEGLNGLRDGILCCMVRYQPGKSSLDRALLIENGVTPEQINASMKQGTPFTVVELPEMES